MSAFPFAFLFDYSGFEAKIASPLNALIAGDFHPLQQTAISLAKINPEILSLAELSRIPFYFKGDRKRVEDIDDAGILPWLLLVIFSYCSDFTTQLDYSIINQVGLNRNHTIDNTKSLGDLLIKIVPKIVPEEYADEDLCINDCPLGWLDFHDIEKINAVVSANTKQYRTSTDDKFLMILEKAIASKQNIILGYWFN